MSGHVLHHVGSQLTKLACTFPPYTASYVALREVVLYVRSFRRKPGGERYQATARMRDYALDCLRFACKHNDDYELARAWAFAIGLHFLHLAGQVGAEVAVMPW